MDRRDFIERAGYLTPFSKSIYDILSEAGWEWSGEQGVNRNTPGTVLWEHKTNREIRSSPTVSDGSVYFGTYKSVFDGAIQADDTPSPFYALDAETGEELWRFGTRKGVSSTATIDGGLVYFGTNDGTLYCLGSTSGEEEWSFQTSGGIRSSPTVEDEILYIGAVEFGKNRKPFQTDEDGDFRRKTFGTLYAISSGTGEEIWSFDTPGAVVSSPVLKDGTVYVTSEKDMYAVEAETGNLVWRFNPDQPSTSTPTIADGRVYFGETDWEGSTVYSLDAETGNELWSVDRPRSVRGTLTVRDGVVYHSCEDGAVYAVDAETGEDIWRSVLGETDEHTTENIGRDAGERIRSGPTVTEDRLYVGSYDGSLYVLDTQDGEVEWKVETDGNVHSSPVVVNGTVYFGSFDGSMYAVNTETDGSGLGSRADLGVLGYNRSS